MFVKKKVETIELYTSTHDCKFPCCSHCVISSCSESGINTLCRNSEMKRSLNASYSTRGRFIKLRTHVFIVGTSYALRTKFNKTTPRFVVF